MKLGDQKGIKTGRWLVNEILHADDINFLSQSRYQLATDILATLAEQGKATGSTADLVISGLMLEHDTLLTCDLLAGAAVSYKGAYFNSDVWSFVVSAGKIFSVLVAEDTSVAFDTGGASNRIDTVEVRPVRTKYNATSRSFKDPVTGQVASSVVDTRYEYGHEFQILKGTEGAGVAPTHTSGWIKVAEVEVDASATSIVQADIKDVRDSNDWTTEANATVYKTITQADKVPILDAGSRYTADETEGALQEIAGSGRASETVKENADNIGISIKRTGQTIDGEVSIKDCVYYDTGDSKWKKAGKWQVPPQGLYIGSNTVLLSGYISGLTGLTAGEVYWMTGNGLLTSNIDFAYKATRVAYALSITELILGIWLEQDYDSKISAYGFYGGGDVAGAVNYIDYIDTLVTAVVNAVDRGDLSTARASVTGIFGSLYGFYAGGIGSLDIIDYIHTSLLTGNAIDRGNLTVGRWYMGGVSGPQYGFFGGGDANKNNIDYIDTALLTGNAADRGDLSVGREAIAGVSGSQYGFFGGGATYSDVIDYIDMTLITGNAIDRGNLTVLRKQLGGVSGPQYGFFGGGYTGAISNVIDYIDLFIITVVNALDRGDLSVGRSDLAGVSGPKYGHYGGGYSGGDRNEIDYIDMTLITGNAIDRGNLTIARPYLGGVT